MTYKVEMCDIIQMYLRCIPKGLQPLKNGVYTTYVKLAAMMQKNVHFDHWIDNNYPITGHVLESNNVFNICNVLSFLLKNQRG